MDDVDKLPSFDLAVPRRSTSSLDDTSCHAHCIGNCRWPLGSVQLQWARAASARTPRAIVGQDLAAGKFGSRNDNAPHGDQRKGGPALRPKEYIPHRYRVDIKSFTSAVDRACTSQHRCINRRRKDATQASTPCGDFDIGVGTERHCHEPRRISGRRCRSRNWSDCSYRRITQGQGLAPDLVVLAGYSYIRRELVF